MERTDYLEKLVLPFLLIMYTVGIIGHTFVETLHLMKILTPYTLLLTGGVVFYFLIYNNGRKFLYWYLITYSLTLLLEIVGVKTGLIFGEYSYGEILGLKVFDTPLIIGMNWVFVVAGAYALSSRIFKSSGISILFTGLLGVAFDVILEPVAIKLGYWEWSEGYIPFQNFVAWFLLSALFGLIAHKFELKFKSDLAVNYFLIQAVFFGILNFTL